MTFTQIWYRLSVEVVVGRVHNIKFRVSSLGVQANPVVSLRFLKEPASLQMPARITCMCASQRVLGV